MKLIRNRKRAALTGGALVLLAGMAWIIGNFLPNPHLARAKELREQLTSRSLSKEERKDAWDQLRKEVQQIPPDQRRNLWREQQQKQLKAYFALSPKEKTAYLDKMIQQMEQNRRAWQQAAANKNSGQPGGPSAAFSRRTLSPEQREQRRKARLDFSTPEDRAMRHQFTEDMRARRQQLGLSSLAGPWGRR